MFTHPNNTDSLICRLVGNLYRRDLGAGAMRGVGARQLHWAELAERDPLKRSAHMRPAVRGSGRGQERRQSGSLHGRNVSECGRGFSLKIQPEQLWLNLQRNVAQKEYGGPGT